MPGSDLRLALADMRGAVREQVALAPFMHLRIGGPAQWFVEPYAEDDVALAVRVCRELAVPLRVLGGGSNILCADEGVPGVVLFLGSLNRMVRDGTRVTAGAGVTLASLLRGTKDLGLAGLEVLTGIPAQVGGAVAMNAGTQQGETFDTLVSLTVVDAEGRVRVLPRSELRPQYRDGGLGEAIVVQATFELHPDDPSAIYERFATSLKRRNATQPVTQRSAGCVFRNPPGDAAGRLIEAAGCKTLGVGDLEVSGMHANYILNKGQGSCRDFLALMAEVRSRVQSEFGIHLVAEVKYWGPDPAP